MNTWLRFLGYTAMLWLGVLLAILLLFGRGHFHQLFEQQPDEDPDDRAVRERAINETLAIIDACDGNRWEHDFPWLRHPANRLTEEQIRLICDQIHADMEAVEPGEEIL